MSKHSPNSGPPKTARQAHKLLQAQRASWLANLQIGGREELLFELEMLLRAVELAFEHRYHSGKDGPFGTDYTEQLRTARNALHRSALLAQRLSNPDVERGFHFRSYLERLHADARAPRLSRELVAQRSPEESLYLLRQSLSALVRLADQLLKLPVVTFTSYGDFGTLVEQTVLANRFFKPPSLLDFRQEYDRIPSVRVLELLRDIEDARYRKAVFLAFLACYRILRQLRLLPSGSTVLPRRSLLLLHLARVECTTLANFLEVDLPRLAAQDPAASLLLEHAQQSAQTLRQLAAHSRALLRNAPVSREKLQELRQALSDGLKATATGLVQSLDPATEDQRLFDEETVRLERALHLRDQLWMLAQLVRESSEDPNSEICLRLLLRFYSQFQHVGYHLLRQDDREAVRFCFEQLRLLEAQPVSRSRKEQLHPELKRLDLLCERTLALVSRRAVLSGVPLNEGQLQEALEDFREEAKKIDDTLPPFSALDDGGDIFQALSNALLSTQLSTAEAPPGAEAGMSEGDNPAALAEDFEEPVTQPIQISPGDGSEDWNSELGIAEGSSEFAIEEGSSGFGLEDGLSEFEIEDHSEGEFASDTLSGVKEASLAAAEAPSPARSAELPEESEEEDWELSEEG